MNKIIVGIGTMGLLLIIGAHPAYAQAAQPTLPATPATNAATNPAPPAAPAGAAQSQQMAPIIVTGSAIPTTDTEGASPVVVIDSSTIERRGYQTMEDVLRNLPANGSASSAGQTSNAFAAGGAYVSLRGLGPQATLVLINGRRVTNYASSANGQYAFVDLNSIPAQIVDRVEVLTEGTAIYGADAVAGVVNIITKKDLGGENGEVDAYVGNTGDKDAFEQRYTIMGSLSGFDKNGTGMVEADYEHQNSIFAGDRSISSSANQDPNGGFDLRSARVYPGEFYDETDNNLFTLTPNSGNGPLTGTTPGTDGRVVPDPNFGFPFPYNYNPDTSIIPDTTRYGVYMTYSYKFYDGNVIPNIDFDYRHNRTVLTSAPAGTVIGDDNPPETSPNPNIGVPIFIVPANNPFNQTGEPIDILSYRFVPIGPRIENVDSDVFRAVPSVDIKLGDGWTLNAGFNYSYTFLNDRANNFPSDTAFQNELNDTNPATAYNPFTTSPNGSGNTAAAINGLYVTSGNRDTTSLIGEDFRLNGKLFDLPAGPVQMAFGGEYRLERYDQDYGPEDLAGNVISSSVQLDTAASQKSISGYTEVDIPITSPTFNCPGFYSMDVQVAGRVDKYSQFGSTENPQIRLRWETIPGLVIRGGYSTAFRAPGLNELAAGGNQSFVTVFDPQTNTQPEILVNSPGNPNLKPETAEIFSAGVAYTPSFVQGLLLTADYFKIIYKNQIEQTSAQDLINENSPLVIRTPEGNIQSVSATYENLSNSYIDGVDIGGKYVMGDPYTNYGQLTYSLNGTFLFNYVTDDGTGAVQNVGEDSGGLGPYSRYRQEVDVTWDYHNFSFTLSNDFSSAYQDSLATPVNAGLPANGQAIERNVAAWITFDVQASYTFDRQEMDKWAPLPKGDGFDWRGIVDGTKITVGCNNVYDFQPPFTANTSDTLGYDPAYADPTGRFIYASISKKF